MNNLLRLLPVAVLLIPLLVSAEVAKKWTLDATARHIIEVAPELKSSDAEINVQQGRAVQASAWPNPKLSVTVDDSLGIEDSRGGFDFTQLELSQPIPVSRLEYQRTQAEAEVQSATAQKYQLQQELEYITAKRYHALQLTQARLELAEQRLRQANTYRSKGHHQGSRSDPLIRFLTPLEIMRLDIVVQAAYQMLEAAEGEYSEAEASLKSLLMMPADVSLELVQLTPVAMPVAYERLERGLIEHPALVSTQHKLAASQAAIEVAATQRFEDPTLSVFAGKDYLANRRRDTVGFMLRVQLPLWNQNMGGVDSARASVQKVQAERAIMQRDLQASLRKSYLHLEHLIKQAEHYQNMLLKPAEKVYKLTRKGFDVGELGVLGLIDANNTYFDAQESYLELLYAGWIELAEVRRSAGVSLLAKRRAVTASSTTSEVN